MSHSFRYVTLAAFVFLAACATKPSEHAVTRQELTQIVMSRGHLGVSWARQFTGWWNGKTGSSCIIWYLRGDLEARDHERRHCQDGAYHK